MILWFVMIVQDKCLTCACLYRYGFEENMKESSFKLQSNCPEVMGFIFDLSFLCEQHRQLETPVFISWSKGLKLIYFTLLIQL